MPPTNKVEDDPAKEFHPAPVWLTKCYIEKVFRNYKKNQNLKVVNLEITPATAKGDNYASVMTRIKVNFDDSSNPTIERNKDHFYIVKTSFEGNKFASDIFKEYKTFDCEMRMYESVLPKLTEILRRMNKSECLFPEIIFVDWENTAMIMEDLSVEKYVTADRTERLDCKHAKFALNQLAKMHAASLVLCNEMGKDYLVQFDRGIINRSTQKFHTFFEGFTTRCAEVAIEIGGEYKLYGEKLLKLIPYVMERATRDLDVEEGKTFAVLNHGDFWTNNIMFKYNENGEIMNGILIDFQFCKWTSPAWDLHYYFATSLKEEQRHKGQDELFKFYYDNLIENLKKLDYKGNVPNLNQFTLEMAKKEFLGLISAFTSAILLINDKTEDAEFDTLIKTDERSINFRKVAYSNPAAIQAVKNMLPIYNKRGLLDL